MKTILLVGGQDDRKMASLIRGEDGTVKMRLPGNVSLRSAFEDIGVLEEVILGLDGNNSLSFRQPDLVINLICDADANQRALSEAADLIKQLGKPVINDPQKVMRTGRQSIAQTAAAIDGLVAPQVVVIRPRRLKEIEDLWRSGEIPQEFLIRPLTGEGHDGAKLLRVSSEAELNALEQYAFDGGAFGITPFIDYRSRDGNYRKGRLVFIDGAAYPRHWIVSSDWMIHASTRVSFMTNREDLQAEEHRFLTNPREFMGPVAWAALHELTRRSALDFVGIDFSLLPDGRALLFECNAGMNTMAHSASWAYVNPAREQIGSALRDMVVNRL